MLHHLAGATIQVANLVIFNCQFLISMVIISLTLMVFLKFYLEKFDFEKNQRKTRKHAKLPSKQSDNAKRGSHLSWLGLIIPFSLLSGFNIVLNIVSRRCRRTNNRVQI